MALGPCRFTNAAGGTVDWTYPGPTIDMQSPTAAGAADGTVYEYYAQSLDMSQWEKGTGAYTASTGVFARTTVLANSLGTTAKISFTNPPEIVFYDLFAAPPAVSAVLYTSQTLTAPQQAQARSNIGAALAPPIYAKVSLSTPQTVSGITKVAFDTAGINVGSGWDTTNHWFKPNVAGTYEISFAVRVAGTVAQGGGVQADLSKNGTIGGTGASVGDWVFNSPAAGGAMTAVSLSGTTFVQMNGTTDTLELDVQQGSITTPSLDNNFFRTSLTAKYIGP